MTQALTKHERAALREAARTELAFRSLHEFVKQAWQVLEPNTPFIDNWHIKVKCAYLTAVTEGRIQRLVINEPPGMSKSRVVSVCWPVWEWLHRPWLRHQCFSYSEDLSLLHARERRDLIQSAWFQERWAHIVKLRPDHNLKGEVASTSPPGMMTATSIKGTATGKGGERLIIDDPLNPKQAASGAELKAVADWWRETLPTRMRDQSKGAVVLVMQRLADGDPSGIAIASGWRHLCLPMEFDPAHPFRSPHDPRTKPGELLCPARINAEQLATLKRDMGSYAVAGQFQQLPSPKGGGVVKLGWFRYWREMPTVFDELLQSWDFTFKHTDEGSFIVGQVWGRRGPHKFLLDQVRARGEFTECLAMFRALTGKWPQARRKLVEEKANGAALISTLRGEIEGIVAVNPSGSKEARLRSVAPTIEAGDVLIPDPAIAPWVNDYIHELCSFPHGSHDDQVDATSQALEELKQSAAGIRGTLANALQRGNAWRRL